MTIAAVWAAITSRAGRWLVAAGAVLGVLWATYRRGRADATERARARQAEAAQRAAKERADADAAADRAADPAGELQRDWRRP